MLAKLRQKLPDIKVLNFIILVEKIEVGYYYFFAENLPLMK
jgi:hypothetical protein